MSGWTGSPGLMTQYFSPAVAGFNEALAQLAVDRVRDAMQAGASLWPSSFTWSIDGTVDELDEADGQLLDSLTVTPRSGAGSEAGGAWGPTPVGVCVTWKTADVKAGNRVSGRTFLVPICSVNFQADGSPAPEASTKAAAFAAAMNDAGATDLVHVVWARPRTGVVGTKHGITGYSIRDKYAVLTSRRD